jgi:hypothetical protein
MINKLSKTFRLSGNPGDYILATKRDQRPFTTRGTIIIIPAHLCRKSYILIALNG